MIDPAIKKIEDLIARYHKLKPSTRLMREKLIAQMTRVGKLPTTQSIGYWRNYFAALQMQVAKSCEPHIALAKEGDESALKQISRGVAFLDKVEATKPKVGERKVRQGRVKNLAKVREGWQEAVFANLLLEKWKLPFAAIALSGCRPEELDGLCLQPTDQDGVLIFIINGSKVTEKSGQEWRKLTIDVRRSSYGNALLAEYGNRPHTFEIKNSSQAITKQITRAAQRAGLIRLNQTLPAYSCRNAVASGMKADGFAIDVIAGALGHSSDECQKFYGRARAGHKSGAGKILAIETARPVRSTGRSMNYSPKKAML